MASPERPSEHARDMLTNCERSMRYHQERTRFYESLHRWILFLIFLMLPVAVLRPFEFWQVEAWIWLPAVAAVLAGASLVFDLAGKARRHESLYQRFTHIAGRIASESEPDADKIADWEYRIYKLYADEPPTYRALNALCHNQMAQALGSKKEDFLILRWYHRFFRNLYPFQGTNFPNQQ